MKLIKTFIVATGALALLALTSQASLTLNFSSTPGSTIQFNGSQSSFQFNDSTLGSYSGSQWVIGSESGIPAPANSALGLFGVVEGGPFHYGAITTDGQVETASVTGPNGNLSINDGSSHFLTGTVNWMTVSTYNSIGGINAALTVNVSDLAYGGLNTDLLRVVTEAGTYGGAMNISFQFNPAEDLIALTSGTPPDGVSGPPYTTSFSGSLAVAEPTTMIAGMLLLLPFGASTLRVLRKKRGA